MIRILFVDDEPRVLDGLRRTLRPLKDKWEMSFAESASNALDMLAQKPFDVIVTDMQMPDVNGYALLNTLQCRFPHVARIVLSGHSSAEADVRAFGLADSYLAKPCGMAELTSAVERLAPAAASV